jgi:dihydroneopterin aldolase
MMKSWISLNDLQIHAHHGVLEHERICGNMFTINLHMKVDITSAAATDDLRDALNYAEVYEAVKEEMGIPSRLLEHVAMRIIQRLFCDFPQIEAIKLKLEKHHPPMNADIKSASIEIEKDRQA